MGLPWVAVVAAVMLYLPDDYRVLVVWLWPLISSVLMGCGVAVYLGGHMLLAGFNTMSEGERSAFDMDRVTSFTGISLALLSYGFFLIWPLSAFYGPTVSLVMTVAFAAGTILMVVLLNTARFKAVPPRE